MKKYRIFVINPGSTSTKLSLHENEEMVFSTDVFHDSSFLKTFETINDQLDYRMEVIEQFLKENSIDLTGIDAIVGRGGGCYSVESGVYEINDALIRDTREARGSLYHSSMLGVQMADRLRRKYGGLALMMDPPVVDELDEVARITGVKGIYRKAICHALENYVPTNSRSQLMQTAKNRLIVDAYNANPSSMEAALTNFRLVEAEHKMAILGDMRELGESSREEHQRIANLIAESGLETVWLVGDEFAKVDWNGDATTGTCQKFHDVEEVKAAIASQCPEGYTILVKGSNGTKLFQLPELL